VLRDYFASFKNLLSSDNLKRFVCGHEFLTVCRLDRGSVLRILDSKDEVDKKIIQNAPLFSESLNTFSKDRFQRVLRGLDNLGELL
jgi:histidyl-tRNA synthetase